MESDPHYDSIYEWLARKALEEKYDISEEYDIEAAIAAVLKLLDDEDAVLVALINTSSAYWRKQREQQNKI